MLSLRGLVLVLLLCVGCTAFQSSLGRHDVSRRRQLTQRPLLKRPLMRIPIVDDVLDYLTNQGGYTGFTEAQLKGDRPLTEADTENFGKELATDDRVTTAFVLLLLATPFLVGVVGFKLGVFVVPRFARF